MMLSIIAGLDALPLLAPPGAVAWRPLVGPCPPYPARRGPAARASVYVDARALSWHHGFEAEGLGYLKLSLGKGRKTFVNSSGRVYAFGAWMHAAPCFPTGLALGTQRWSRGPELARVAVRSQSRQLAGAGPQSAARMRQYFLKPEYFVVLVNGMVLNKHTARVLHPLHGERES